jgi:hypothetical protein
MALPDFPATVRCLWIVLSERQVTRISCSSMLLVESYCPSVMLIDSSAILYSARESCVLSLTVILLVSPTVWTSRYWTCLQQYIVFHRRRTDRYVIICGEIRVTSNNTPINLTSQHSLWLYTAAKRRFLCGADTEWDRRGMNAWKPRLLRLV